MKLFARRHRVTVLTRTPSTFIGPSNVSASTCVCSSIHRTTPAAKVFPTVVADDSLDLPPFPMRWWPLSTAAAAAAPFAALTTSKRSFASTRQFLGENRRKPSTKLGANKSAPLPEDPLGFIALTIRSVTNNTGPIPLSKLTPLLADEFLETIGQHGMSLATLIEKYPNYLTSVQLPGHVIIAMPAHLRKNFATAEKCQLGVWVMALLSATHFLPGQPQVTAMGLSSPHPTIEELCNALRYWTNVIPVQLEILLRGLPEFFAVNTATRRVRFLIVNTGGRDENIKRSLVGMLAPRLMSIKPPEASKFSLWLRTVVPSQFHVPVSHVMDRARELNALETAFGTANPSLDQIKGQFQQLPQGFADIRAFGDAPNTVFVRILDPEPLLLESGVPTYGGSNAPPECDAARYNPTRLAHELTAAIEDYANQSQLTKARVTKGLEMSRLRDYVPPALMHKLEQFYGFSEKDDPGVCILMLDRLRHLWEVQLSAGTARPWVYLPESEMPSSLTLQTSPAPRVLLHFQRLLIECGAQPLMDLYNVLPSDLKNAFMDIYSPPSEKHTEEGSAAAALPPSDTQITGTLQTFVRTHSLFFFIQDNYVHSSHMVQPRPNDRVSPVSKISRAASLQRQPLPTPYGGSKRSATVNRDKTLTDAEMAQLVYDTIPADSWISADVLRNYLSLPTSEYRMKKRTGIPVQTFRREFFQRYHRFFDIHNLFAYDKLVVSRSGFEVKAPHLLSPRINTISRLVKLMALLSMDCISDASLTRRLPPEGRQLVKSLGTVTNLAEQLPMWFAVQRDDVNFGTSLIRYIGPLANTPRSAYALKPHPSGTLTRKVPNDPFADIPPDNRENGSMDGWNDDWNEEENDTSCNLHHWDDDDDH